MSEIDLYGLFQEEKKKGRDDEILRLSGEFYTAIPHRIGRSRAAVEGAVIDTLEAFEQKQQTLQLMKDMLQVNGEGGLRGYCYATPIVSDRFGLKEEQIWYPYTTAKGQLLQKIMRWVWGTPLGRFMS